MRVEPARELGVAGEIRDVREVVRRGDARHERAPVVAALLDEVRHRAAHAVAIDEEAIRN